MTAHRVELIGFADDEALDDVFRRFGLIADYKQLLPGHLTEILRDPDNDLDWEEPAYVPVPLKRAGQVAVQIARRGKLQPMVPPADEG